MKTRKLLEKFKHDDVPPPNEPWQYLIWMAANLIRRAEMERHTYRKSKGKRKSDPRQMELFKC